jgi:hypothetical protein
MKLVFAPLLLGAAVASSLLRSLFEDTPSLVSVSNSVLVFSAATPCPPSLPWGCAQGAVSQLILSGGLFGSAPGSGGGVELAAAVAPAAPVLPPADLPDALQLNSLNPEFAWAAGGGCLVPSAVASTDFDIEVCPYNTSYLRARGGGARVASLGAFSGVVRQNVSDCVDDGTFGVTGLLFAGGDACGTNGTRSAQVNFVCTDVANPWAARYLANATVVAASASPDGCTWQLDVPLASACIGDFDLCSTLPNPAPNAPPAPAPFNFSRAFVAAWASNSITVYAPVGETVRAARVLRYDGVASALVVPLPAPLPPSASPIPMPFPTALTVRSAFPAAGLSFAPGGATPCVNGPVAISLEGVQPADLEGAGAGFDLTVTRGPALQEVYPLFGSPMGAAGGVTRVPANGRLDLVLPCGPSVLEGFPTPYTAQFIVRSRFTASNGALATRRVAACAPGACSWTFWGPTPPSPTPTPMPTPTPAPPAAAAAAAALSGPVLYGVIGGSVGFVALVAGVAAYFCWWAKPRGSKGAAPTPPRTAWGGAIEMNPVAVALKGHDGVQDWSSK